MTVEEFEIILDSVVLELTEDARKNQPCFDPKEFEKVVLRALKSACRAADVEPDESFHPHAFPDIKVNGFGVEVKHTKKHTWTAIGNSIFEGMREESAKLIYIVFGKMGGFPEVRWARYEDCVTHVRISHAPRFVIEMDRIAPLFKTINMEYAVFRELSPDEKMRHVREYARNRLNEGERLWWLEDLEDQEHSLPMSVKIYRTLTDAKKLQMRAEATLLCPEVVQAGSKRGKYDRAGLYLITQHGVFAPQLRDLFTAGSVGGKGGQRGGKYIIRATKAIESEMKTAAAELDSKLIEEYWGHEFPPESRINEWLKKADHYATDWVPSEELFKGG